MLFNSHIFIFLFLPLTLAGFFLLSQRQSPVLAKYWLTAASLLFYIYGAGESIWILLGSTTVNFILAQAIFGSNASRKSLWLTAGVLLNIGLLAHFKYSFAQLFELQALSDITQTPSKLILPLAISYFTFHQIAYLVDVRIERVPAEKNFLNYLLFVSFFPHLIAGPIVYYRDIMPQILKSETYRFNTRNIKMGVFLFALGLVKKTLFADGISTWVDNGFHNSSQLNAVETITLVYLFGLQVYFDFSAYSDMALGLALMFNVTFPVNFNSPYKSTSIIQFWQQWNITLTSFVSSYVYTPLVRLKASFSFAYSLFATFVAMTMIGLWHGGSWNYILFGMLHGIALVINHLFRKTKIKFNQTLGLFLTLNFFMLTTVFFRSSSIGQALDIYQQMTFWNGDLILHKDNFVTDTSSFYWMLVPAGARDYFTTVFIPGVLLAGYAICLRCNNAIHIANNALTDRNFWIKLGFIMTMGLFMLSKNTPFIYFQF